MTRAKNLWHDGQSKGAGGGEWAWLLGGDAVRSSGAHGHGTVVSLNCCVIDSAIGVIHVAGHIGHIVIVQGGKRVVVVYVR